MSKPNKSISVCGCGWLGMPLAKQLVSSGFKVIGTKRSASDAEALNQYGIHGIQFDLMTFDRSPPNTAIFDADTLVLNIPPGRRTIDKASFVTGMKAVIDEAKSQGVGQVIFISTTSVYGSAKGVIDESTLCTPDTESGMAHVELEQHVIKQFADQGVVLRLSGLVGGERHPARYLAGRKDIANGNDPVNLIHRDDCINAIQAIIEQNLTGGVYHLSAQEHPTRAAFYQWAAAEMGMEPPTFLDSDGTGKCIDAEATQSALSLMLKYPSPYDMPLPSV
ncbi:SDR family oxidoreductase [Enterovibrio sp. ZSDZ35]|uniref:SDR family oxidoreductase n=1 Tax=Enterovibrio qingdaonensis TaxID=2899818 RepID=A0ABT5QLC5_9GAMM|nr:SDR family oxidoreductase [Enterovibrio sp. ZSDZ35]MDD1781792.1 SDR family oxidoreductase [Enterovibrio sp. ZSDZ35]